jgi:hypothetical protein
MKSKSLSCRGVLYIGATIIGLIILLIQFIVNNLAGCTNNLQNKFVQTELAKNYSAAYIDYINSKYKIYSKTVDWAIEKQGNGCKVEASISSYFGAKNTKFTGDSFFINLEERTIYPISEGAKVFLEQYGGRWSLPK